MDQSPGTGHTGKQTRITDRNRKAACWHKIRQAIEARNRYYWRADWVDYCQTALGLTDEDIRKAARF
jgi:hypothetical protein